MVASPVHSVAPVEGARFAGEVRVLRQLFSAPEGFAVLVVRVGGREHAARGALGHLSAGDTAAVEGCWERHPRHGLQLSVDEASPIVPSDEAGLVSFIESVRHLGRARALQLVDRFGADRVIGALDDDPEAALAALGGMSARARSEAAASWRERAAVRELYVLLAQHGETRALPRVLAHFGTGALTTLRRDPYAATAAAGIGFKTADAIARSLGIAPDSPRRAHAALVHVLDEAAEEGAVCLPWPVLRERARATLSGVDVPFARVAELAVPSGPLRADWAPDPERPGQMVRSVYLRPHFYVEAELAERLGNRLYSRGPGLTARAPARPPAGLLADGGSLERAQWAAIDEAFRRRLLLVTGGPGTGKSVTIGALTSVAAAAGVPVTLTATTNKAAERLASVAPSGAAQTVHGLIGWNGYDEPFHHRDNPLPDGGIVVCDEAGMLDVATLLRLVDALRPEAHLVLAGDPHQLFPVGAGQPFADLLRHPDAAVVRLERVHRQSDGSMLPDVARAVLDGRRPSFAPRPGQRRDVFFIDAPDPDLCAETIVDVATRRAPQFFGVDPRRDVHVLAAMKDRAAIGVNHLNRAIAERLGTGEEVRDERGQVCAHVGDKLLVTRRAAKAAGLVKDQVVLVLGASSGGVRVLVDGRERTLAAAAIRAMTPAYALTVHRAQGSEMPVVVLAVHSAHARVLTRRNVYTAMTRMRTACIMVGERDVLERLRRDDDVRYGRLLWQIGLQRR